MPVFKKCDRPEDKTQPGTVNDKRAKSAYERYERALQELSEALKGKKKNVVDN